MGHELDFHVNNSKQMPLGFKASKDLRLIRVVLAVYSNNTGELDRLIREHPTYSQDWDVLINHTKSSLITQARQS